MTGDRKRIPLSVKLKVALAALGLKESDVEWDHVPALGLRPTDPETGKRIQDDNDPAGIQMLVKKDHAEKTTGRKGTSKNSRDGNGDAQRIAKVKRLEERRATDDGDAAWQRRGDCGVTKFSSGKIPSRPFPTNRTGLFKSPMRGRTERRGT